MVIIIFTVLIQSAIASEILVYKFWKNYGSQFYDYSGNLKHGVNGNSLQIDSQDTIPTDRGAYFNGSTLIKVPTTDAKNSPITISTSYISYMWVYLTETPTNEIILIERTDSSNGIILTLNTDLELSITTSDQYSGLINKDRKLKYKETNQKKIRSLSQITITLNTWYGIGIKVLHYNNNSKKGFGMVNLTPFGNINIPNYDESNEQYYSNIGGRPSITGYSLRGYIWKFKIVDESGVTNINYDACDDSQNNSCLPSELVLGYSSNGLECEDECQGCNDYICLECECDETGCEFDTASNSSVCKCSNGNTSNETCESCNTEYCSSCYSNNTCSECNSGYILKNGSCVCEIANCEECENSNFCTKCSEGYYNINTSCIQCGKYCSQCNFNQCIECEINSSFSIENSSVCDCNSGFRDEGGCTKNYFRAFSSVNSKNEVSVWFNESLSEAFEDKDFEYEVVGDINCKVEFLRVNNEEYLFKVTSDNRIESGSIFNVSLKESYFFSQENSFFIETDLSVKLKQTFVGSKTTKLLNKMMKTTTQVSLIAAGASGIISSPSLFWALFNTLTLISYLPISSLPYSQSLVEFFTNLNMFSMLPSPSKIIGISIKNTEPYLEARKYGIDSSLLFVNIDIILFQLVINLIMLLLLLIGSYLFKSNLKIFCVNQVKKYKYGYFLRLLTAGYLDFTLFSLIQLRTIPITYLGITCTIFATIVLAAMVIAPIFIMRKSYLGLEKIKNRQDTEFYSKFDGLYGEFKNNKGFISTQFYTVFMFRRLLFAVSQVFLNSIHVFQLSLNIAGTFMIIAYTLIYRPYNKIDVMISQILGEITVFITMGFGFGFTYSSKDAEKYYLDVVVMVVVYSCVLAQALVSIVSLFYNICCKRNSRGILKLNFVLPIQSMNKPQALETSVK